MNQKSRTLAGLIIFAIILGCAVAAYNMLIGRDDITPNNIVTLAEPTEPAENAPAEDPPRQQAPNFTILDANDNEIQLSDFFGKPIVLNFWTTWCPSCVRETPYFDALHQELGDEVHVIKVSLVDGQRETRESIDNFMYNNGYTFPLYLDTNGQASGAFGVRSIPLTIFICEEGYLVSHALGALNEQSLAAGLETIGVVWR